MMRILLCVDTHSVVEKLAKAIEKEKADKIICLGDYCKYLTTNRLDEVAELLEKHSALCLPGNTDFEVIQETLKEKGLLVHNKCFDIEGHSFIAYGGGSMPERNHYWNSEEKIYSDLEKLFKGKKNVILLTHVPPYNTRIDDSYSGEHIGSEAVKRIIEEFQPEIHFCGHAHESRGEERIGKTLCVNIGPVIDGYYVVLELGSGLKWERKKL